jgi:hypothetical protein
LLIAIDERVSTAIRTRRIQNNSEIDMNSMTNETTALGGSGGRASIRRMLVAIGIPAALLAAAVSGATAAHADTLASPTTSRLTAPASAPGLSAVTMTDAITATQPGGPAPTGTVTFEMENLVDYSKTVLVTVPVANGVASFTTTMLPFGQQHGIHAIYGGDTNYQGSSSNWVYPNITAAPTTSKLTAPASAPQGRAVTMTDAITATLPGGPAPTGTVTFEMESIVDFTKTVLGTAPVINGVASFTTTTLPFGQNNGIHAIYGGEPYGRYQGSTSNFVYPNITAPIKTIGLNPTTLAFGNQALHSTVVKQVQLTNTGTINWAWTVAATDNGDVNMPSTTCSTLAPGQTCSVSISYQPSVLGAITAHITMASNFGVIAIPVTGTGVTAPQ